jgi:serine/threonine protein kinase
MVSRVATKVGAVANTYQVITKLAAGGMAEIFLARGITSTGVERYCVLKRMLPERTGDPRFVQMFVDEARLALLLQHPNIAAGYDIGTLDDLYFYTMEYVHGATVRSLLQRARELDLPVPLACVLTIIAGAAAGLHHAHERLANDGRPLGIVHRDVSHSNLMVSYEGSVKLIDFGVAKASDRSVQTVSGTVKGKITYLSPEQCRGERVDRRSDLFSLGIVMWEMLTRARLYRRSTVFESMTAIVYDEPPPPSSRRDDIPREVDAIVLRLLAKSVANRFQTAAEVIEAIENASLTSRIMLSAAAVGRLVHDLFGPRIEPWRELEHDRTSAASITVLARPMMPQIAASGIAAEDREPGADVAPSESESVTASTRAYVPAPPDAVARPGGAAAPGAGVVTLSVEVSGSGSCLPPDLAAEPSLPSRPSPDVSGPVAAFEPPASICEPQSSPVAASRNAGAWPAYHEGLDAGPAAAAALPPSFTAERHEALAAAWPPAVAPSRIDGPATLGAATKHVAARAARPVIVATGIVILVGVIALVQRSGRSRIPAAPEPHEAQEPAVEAARPAPHAEPARAIGPASHDGEPPSRLPRAAAADQGVVVAAPPARDRGAASPAVRPRGTLQPPASRERRRGQETIDVEIDSEPAGAQVVLEGRVLGTTPFVRTLPRRDHGFRLEIRRAGYVSQKVVVGSSRPISVALVRDRSPSSPADRDRIVNPF